MIDTHAHLYDEAFKEDLAEVIGRAKAAGVTQVFLPNITAETIANMRALCAQYPSFCCPMIGLHPTDVKDDWNEQLDDMQRLLDAPNSDFIAIGEVGLDFYWDKTYISEQLEAFERQIVWGMEYELPLMLHSRSSHRELVNTLKPYNKQTRGVFHCFSGSTEEATELLSRFPGFALGIGGVVTFKNAHLPETLTHVPLSRIVLETDAPYLAPTPHRGKRNEPAYLPLIIDKLAEVYQTTAEVIVQETTANALRLFCARLRE